MSEESWLPIEHDIARLKTLGRFGGDRLEYIEFSDGQEYTNTLERVVNHYLSPPAPGPAFDAAIGKFVGDLFVNGYGEQADRLVLTTKSGKDLGGWGKVAITEKVKDLVAELRAALAPGAEAPGQLAARDRELAEACELLKPFAQLWESVKGRGTAVPNGFGDYKRAAAFLARRESGSAKGEGT